MARFIWRSCDDSNTSEWAKAAAKVVVKGSQIVADGAKKVFGWLGGLFGEADDGARSLLIMNRGAYLVTNDGGLMLR